MRSLKSFKTNGSSILESVISITVIAICVLVFFTIYNRVIQRTDIHHYQKAVYAIEEFVQREKIRSGKEIQIQSDQKGYYIRSEIVEEHKFSYLVEFTIRINTRKYSVIRNVRRSNDYY